MTRGSDLFPAIIPPPSTSEHKILTWFKIHHKQPEGSRATTTLINYTQGWPFWKRRTCFAEGLSEFGAAASDRSGTRNSPRGNTRRSRGQAGSVHPSLPNLCRGLTWEGSPCPQWFLPVLKGNSLNVVVAATFTHIPTPPWQTCLPGGSGRAPSSFPPAPGKSRVVSNPNSAPAFFSCDWLFLMQDSSRPRLYKQQSTFFFFLQPQKGEAEEGPAEPGDEIISTSIFQLEVAGLEQFFPLNWESLVPYPEKIFFFFFWKTFLWVTFAR